MKIDLNLKGRNYIFSNKRTSYTDLGKRRLLSGEP